VELGRFSDGFRDQGVELGRFRDQGVELGRYRLCKVGGVGSGFRGNLLLLK